MQRKVNFAEKWNGKDRGTTWSGTPYGIYTALEKNGITVNDVPLGESLFDRLLSKLNKAFRKLILKKDDFYLFDIGLGENELKHKKIEQGVPNLFFTQYRFKGLENTYYFQDYSVQFLTRLKKSDPDIMNFTPLKDSISEKNIKKRLAISEECAKKCKGIFTMSKYLAREYVEKDGIPKEKVHWVGGGYNLDFSKIKKDKKTGKRFLFIGTTWETKNGPLVVRAFEKLKKTNEDVELIIAGPKEEPAEIKGKSGIRYVGRIPHDKVIDYYNICDCFVMPSRGDAYGIVFSEALVCGLPCIGKNVLAMPEFIEDDKNGYLIERNDADELCTAMEKFIRNRQRLCEYVNEKNEYYKEYYSWDAVAKRMIKVMEEDGFFMTDGSVGGNK